MMNNFANIVVTGASGAIGKTFINNLSKYQGVNKIYAFSRTKQTYSSSKVTSQVINYEKENEIEDAAKLSSLKAKINLVLVANGILHNNVVYPEKKLEEISIQKFQEIFYVNTILPSLIAKHFIPCLSKETAVMGFMSARVGSISDNKLGGWYAYRSSKAALNMMIKNLSIEVGRRNKKAILVGLHPGTVDSNLSKPFQNNVPAEKLFSPETSVDHLLKVLFNLKLENTGKIYAWDGSEIEP